MHIPDILHLECLPLHTLLLQQRPPYARNRTSSTQTLPQGHEEETQTEEVPSCTRSCQVPEDLVHVSRTSYADILRGMGRNAGAVKVAPTPTASNTSAGPGGPAIPPATQYQQLVAFLRGVAPTIEAWLNSGTGAHLAIPSSTLVSSTLKLSGGMRPLSWAELLGARAIRDMQFNCSSQQIGRAHV